MATQIVKLSSSDNQEFSIPKEVAVQSVLIKNMLEGEFIETALHGAEKDASKQVQKGCTASSGASVLSIVMIEEL
jgi:hypothetical protein